MLTPGTVFHDRYRVERCLKAGGMGSVSEVTDLNTQRRRALKTMLPDIVSDPSLRARFRHEATITSQLDSEHLVEIFDAGIDEATGIPFIVMELLKGEDLGDVVGRVKRLAPADAVSLLYQAGGTLDRTHALGIVHRDLKPENLFLTRRDDGPPRLCILDFGVAKILTRSTHWKTTGILGTPLYMAPEQAVGEESIGPAVDLYALGHVAFTLLVGEAFWEDVGRVHSPVVLLGKVAQGTHQTASERAAALGVELAPGFDAWFAKATARLPRERFETASELVEELARVLCVALPNEVIHEPAMAPAVYEGPPSPSPLLARGTYDALSRDRSYAPRRRSTVSITIALLLVAAIVVAGAIVVPRLYSDRSLATKASSLPVGATSDVSSAVVAAEVPPATPTPSTSALSAPASSLVAGSLPAAPSPRPVPVSRGASAPSAESSPAEEAKGHQPPTVSRRTREPSVESSQEPPADRQRAARPQYPSDLY